MSAETEFLIEWAHRHGVVFDPEGECGFGRECVGIRAGTHWVDLQHLGPDYRDLPDSLPWADVAAPPEVTDAYHKHDCLAVLGRGDEAIHQLYLWVKKLDDLGIGVEMKKRHANNDIELMMHGPQVPVLARKRTVPG